MEKHILSKSTYIKGEQCLKQLYLHKKRPFLRDRMPAERLAIFSRGTNVGIYAQELFPGGIDAGPKHPSQYRKAVIRTAELVETGQEVIYEAAFQANRTLILLDILVKNGDYWDAYEVKSSKSLSEIYYKDAALQFFVLINAGIKINSFSLIHIDENYIRNGEIEKEKLFITTDVTEEVKKRYKQVEKNINNQIEVLSGDHSPKIEIGKHCFDPYDCDFIGHCWKGLKKPSVFDIPSIKYDDKYEYLKNKTELIDLKGDSNITAVQKQQIEVQISKKAVLSLSEDFISKLNRFKIDAKGKFAIKILNFIPALPLYDKTKPYQQLAFAFAIMSLEDDGEIELFISEGKANPNNEILQMINNLTDNKRFTCYNNKNSGIDLLDLRSVCTNNCFYHPAMTQDFSNKELSKALGIKPVWKSVESDIVAAQYYDEILRGHKKSEEKHAAIIKYLKKELTLVKVFYDYLYSKI
ncbi:MAG: hypothetical protein DRI86_13595 [Bacteroidetes bacterium]|nr:MAG: hypothetical protein DRI86_13595 [Bacteroidota bacterium]